MVDNNKGVGGYTNLQQVWYNKLDDPLCVILLYTTKSEYWLETDTRQKTKTTDLYNLTGEVVHSFRRFDCHNYSLSCI